MCTDLLQANFLLIWVPITKELKKNIGAKKIFDSGSRGMTSLVAIATKNFFQKKSNINRSIERVSKMLSKSSKNHMFKINISEVIGILIFSKTGGKIRVKKDNFFNFFLFFFINTYTSKTTSSNAITRGYVIKLI